MMKISKICALGRTLSLVTPLVVTACGSNGKSPINFDTTASKDNRGKTTYEKSALLWTDMVTFKEEISNFSNPAEELWKIFRIHQVWNTPSLPAGSYLRSFDFRSNYNHATKTDSLKVITDVLGVEKEFSFNWNVEFKTSGDLQQVWLDSIGTLPRTNYTVTQTNRALAAFRDLASPFTTPKEASDVINLLARMDAGIRFKFLTFEQGSMKVSGFKFNVEGDSGAFTYNGADYVGKTIVLSLSMEFVPNASYSTEFVRKNFQTSFQWKVG